jgi:methylmalonyl-CoA/ethylmalonyl-CoA epimerase
MIKKIDHVAMVVKDTQKSVTLFSNLFGFETVETRPDPEGGFKSTLISKAEVILELIEPTAPQGPIRNFVEKRGGGLHHISVQVTGLDDEMARLRTLGIQFVSNEPLQINEDTRLAFIHPRSTDGLMIELIERK